MRARARCHPRRSMSPILMRAFSCQAAHLRARASSWCCAEDNTVVYTISGADQAAFRPAVVDLKPYAGKNIFIRLVDEETGAPTAAYLRESPWAHINFDDFRFYDTRPSFPNEIVPSEMSTLPPMDVLPYAGLSGADAAKAMTLPPGFSVDPRGIRARHRQAHRVHARRSGTALGCRVTHLSRSCIRRPGAAIAF